MQLRGANKQPKASGEQELPGKSNYFIGSDPSKWRRNVPTFAKVRYSEMYPGIDLVYYGQGQQLEYDFVVAPHADATPIRLGFEGSAQPSISADGDLVLQTEEGGGQVRLRKPVAYQLVNGSRQKVGAEFTLSEAHEVSFKLGHYDVEQPLVIDPVLTYSTYLGGNGFGDDIGLAIAVDSLGNAYVAGMTSSPTFPTANPFQPANAGGDTDAFVAKLNSAGSGLVYSTYLGGLGGDQAQGIAVDTSGNAYITGYTYSTNFPTANPFQPVLRGGRDAFVAKLNSTGSGLLYSTYLGGSAEDRSLGIAIESSGNATIAGFTESSNFPTVNPLQSALGGDGDAFVTKLNAAGSALLYSTYLGGSFAEEIRGIALDSFGNATVTGFTNSTNFPTANAIQPALAGGSDAFVTRLNASGSSLLYSTYLGGSGEEKGRGIAVDASGNAYVTGVTNSTNFPTVNAFQSANAGSSDTFVTKLNAAGSTLVYSTYLGGSGPIDRTEGVDDAWAIAVDAAGNAYVTGSTTSTNFPTVNPSQPALRQGDGGPDVFITKFNAAGSALLYSTYFGGKMDDFAYGIAVKDTGDGGSIYVTGLTGSTDFPVVNAMQPTKIEGGDAIILRISSSRTVLLPAITSITPPAGAPGTVVNVSLEGGRFISGSTRVLISGIGVTVGNVSVISPTQLTTSFSIPATAENEYRDVTVTTPNGASNRVTFLIHNSDTTECPVSLPLTVTGSRGNLAVTAGIGTRQPASGSWVLGRAVFNASSISFYGSPLFSGVLPAANPPLSRSLSFNMAPLAAVAVVNAFYNPNLCAYSMAWASTTSFAPPYAPVPRDQVDAFVRRLTLQDFNLSAKEFIR